MLDNIHEMNAWGFLLSCKRTLKTWYVMLPAMIGILTISLIISGREKIESEEKQQDFLSISIFIFVFLLSIADSLFYIWNAKDAKTCILFLKKDQIGKECDISTLRSETIQKKIRTIFLINSAIPALYLFFIAGYFSLPITICNLIWITILILKISHFFCYSSYKKLIIIQNCMKSPII